MATGYTSDVRSGAITAFADFAMLCARAFGAAVTMRDLPLNEPIPEFTPSTYHSECAVRYAADLAALEAMSPEDIATGAERDFAEALKKWRDRRRERLEAGERYHAMLDHVHAWKPPTPEHEGMKEFMLDQLKRSIEHDCSDRFDAAPVVQKPDAWHAAKVESVKRLIEQCKKLQAEENQRVQERNQWVRELRASLPAQTGRGHV